MRSCSAETETATGTDRPESEPVPVSYPLDCPDPRRRDLVADDVLAAFEKAYDLSEAPRLKDTLRNALYVLVKKQKTLLASAVAGL